jgi:Fanconi anemia group J protein
MSVLGSREQLCIHPDVVKEPGKKIEKCKELVKESKCEYYRKAEESAKQSKFTDEFVWDIEDIVKEGKRNEFCPYFAARVLADEAEFIIAPYNYVLDPVIRNSMKINLNGAVVVIDEAHNLENACRDIASRNFREDEIVLVINELHSLLDSRTIKDFVKDAFKRMHEKLRSLGNIIEANRHKLSISEFEKEQNVFKGQDILNLFDTLDCTPETYSNIMRDVKIIAEHVMESARNASPYMETQTQESQESQNGEQAKSRKSDSLSQHSLSLLEGFSMVIDFIFSNNCQHLNDFRLVIQREAKNVDSESKWDTYIGFWCMNPAVSFKNMAKGAHSIILTSGTLSPMNSFASELGVEFPHRLETAHIIPRSNIFVRAISHGPNGVKLECTYKNTEVYKFQDDLGETLLSVFPNCPDGVLVFFPSYG